MSDTMQELEGVTTILRKDLRAYIKTVGREEARFLVDAYYTMQDQRIRTAHQHRTLDKAAEPNAVLEWLRLQSETLELEVAKALDYYSGGIPLGQWARSIVGIGPVIAAGLLAHIDMTKAETAGQIWRFAGLDPTSKWNKGEKRPWNADLKRLCWIIGESFVKTGGNKNSQYGPVYKARKELEWQRNIGGEFSAQAAESLQAKKFGRQTDAVMWYEGHIRPEDVVIIMAEPDATKRQSLMKKSAKPGSGVPMLPPARIHLRATRYAVKLFLAHYHHVGYELLHRKAPPMPYILAHPEADPRGMSHVHFLAPPNWPMNNEKAA